MRVARKEIIDDPEPAIIIHNGGIRQSIINEIERDFLVVREVQVESNRIRMIVLSFSVLFKKCIDVLPICGQCFVTGIAAGVLFRQFDQAGGIQQNFTDSPLFSYYGSFYQIGLHWVAAARLNGEINRVFNKNNRFKAFKTNNVLRK